MTEGRVTVEREIEADVREVIEMTTPCVVGAAKGLNRPRCPTLPDMMKAKKKEIRVIPRPISAFLLPFQRWSSSGFKRCPTGAGDYPGGGSGKMVRELLPAPGRGRGSIVEKEGLWRGSAFSSRRGEERSKKPPWAP